MTLDEALELLKENGYTPELNEDFGIGVGAPCGLDQGIPHGGDCKGCAPQRMGLLYQRSPYAINPLYKGVADAHHPDYWLNQLPKKRKKKKKKKRLTESMLKYIIEKFENVAWTIYKKLLMKKDIKLYNADEFKLYTDFDAGFNSDVHPTHRPAQAGHYLSIIFKNFLREYHMLDDESDDSETKSLFKKYLGQFKKEISRPWYLDDKVWTQTI